MPTIRPTHRTHTYTHTHECISSVTVKQSSTYSVCKRACQSCATFPRMLYSRPRKPLWSLSQLLGMARISLYVVGAPPFHDVMAVRADV